MFSFSNIKVRLFQVVYITIVCLLCCSDIAVAQLQPLDCICLMPSTPLNQGKDTIGGFSLLQQFDFDIEQVARPGDTIRYTRKKVNLFKDIPQYNPKATLIGTATIKVAPQLLYQPYAFVLSLEGSAELFLNQKQVFSTGIFSGNKTAFYAPLKLNNEVFYFTFQDTVTLIKFIYVPVKNCKYISYNISIAQPELVSKLEKENTIVQFWKFGMVIFYLALFLVFFVLYIYFKDNSENLIFGLFCLLFALSQVNYANFFDIGDYPLFYTLILLATETFAIFLSKILLNKKRSKIPVLIIIAAGILLAFPVFKTILSATGTWSIFGEMPMPPALFCIFIYSMLSATYYTIVAITKKKWEAKIIGSWFILGFLVFVFTPMIINFLPILDDSWLNYLQLIGIFMIPFGSVIVLGKRNAQYQQRLLLQISSIEQLSAENLEKEREKQELLENQNVQLEQKVQERTTEVMKQKQHIELKNREITDNINYALRIQSAILPDVQLINKAFPASFVLYMPKDIVSGDFYGFEQRDGKYLLMVGDCTGHGVSGAFMSIIGSTLLNQLINEKGISNPAEILDLLNESIIASLKQNENENHDGMDIAILAIDIANMQLEYASANRPVWLIRHGELVALKPDKFPIGSLHASHKGEFTLNTLPLMAGDVLYGFTDGYADQFGGEYGKKMMTAKFKELLMSMQQYPMAEQEELLRKYFYDWKGTNEQVDDVLVVGIRI